LPLLRFLGVPDPLPGGLGLAGKARILDLVGGPDDKALRALGRQADVGVLVTLVVPRGGNGRGIRLLVRARATGTAGEIRVGPRAEPVRYDRSGTRVTDHRAPRIHGSEFVSVKVPPGPEPVELHTELPSSFGLRPGRSTELVVFAERQVAVESIAVVPLADELPPPPPEPWKRSDGRPLGLEESR